MFLDDLPIWGEMAILKDANNGGGEKNLYIYLHKKLTIYYNGPHIVEVVLEMEDAEQLGVGKQIEYTYEVRVE